MTFRNAGINKSLREFLGKTRQTRARFHGGGYGNNALILTRFCHQRIAENARIRRSSARLFQRLARCGVKRTHAMESHRVIQRRSITFAFFRNHVDNDRTIRRKRRLKNFAQKPNVMTVNRRSALNAQLLVNHGAGQEELLHGVLHAATELNQSAPRVARMLQHVLHGVARLLVLGRGAHGAEMLHKRAHVARN